MSPLMHVNSLSVQISLQRTKHGSARGPQGMIYLIRVRRVTPTG